MIELPLWWEFTRLVKQHLLLLEQLSGLSWQFTLSAGLV
jgi:hypothetical protein